MGESKRQQKFSRQIQKDIGEIFQRDSKGIVGNAFITVTEVKMSPDLSVAKIYLSMMMVEDKEGLMQVINDRKSEIRKILGNKIGKQARVVPELIFYIDDTGEKAAKIDELLDNLNIPEENDKKGNKDNK